MALVTHGFSHGLTDIEYLTVNRFIGFLYKGKPLKRFCGWLFYSFATLPHD